MPNMILKHPGSKWRMAKDIISYIPEHHSYLKPFFGSGAVFFNKLPSNIETINDLDNRVYLLFQMVRENPEKVAQMVMDTPFCRYEYDNSFLSDAKTDEELVRKLLIQCWQGYGYRIDGNAPGWKNDVQGRERSYSLSNWNRLPEWIMEAGKRLKETQITNEPAIHLIERFNFENVFIYADPPYLLSTRYREQYLHEMTDKDHADLLETLRSFKGKVILSGYKNPLYDDILKDWPSVDIETTAERGLKRTETLWFNYEPYMQLSMWE